MRLLVFVEENDNPLISANCHNESIVTKLEETQLTSIALSVFVTNLFKIHKRILYALLYLFQYGNGYKCWSMQIFA